MSLDVILFFTGLVFIGAWGYSAINAHKAHAALSEEETMGISFRSSNESDLMRDVNVPEVFDEQRLANDLARLASNPTAVGKYLAQAEIRFTHNQQIKVLNQWKERYNAGEAVIKARTAMGEAYGEYTLANAQAEIAARNKAVKLANLDADFEEAQLRKEKARKAQEDLKKKEQATLTAEQERILRKNEIESNIIRLESECAKKLGGVTDEDRRMQIQNMYDDQIHDLEEQLRKYL